MERPVGVSHPKWVPTGHFPESVSRELSERKQRGVCRCGHRLRELTTMNQFSREEVRVANEAVRPLRLDDIDNEDGNDSADDSENDKYDTHDNDDDQVNDDDGDSNSIITHIFITIC